jgi:hypothetical protein
VCAKGIKKELNTLDEADFVRDVANRVYHYQSQNATKARLWCVGQRIQIGILVEMILAVAYARPAETCVARSTANGSHREQAAGAPNF